jgi:hypothetical protein
MSHVNTHLPEIARMRAQYSQRGVQFWWVFPNPEDRTAVITKHNRDFSIKESTLLDPRQTTVHLAHVTTTPEAALFIVERGSLHELFHGRIDDRYLAIGQERPLPQHRDLEDAIRAALHGKAIEQPAGPPVGCSIVHSQE